MIKGALYAAIGFAAISSIALAEDFSSATAPLPPGTFTTAAYSDEWKIANALSAGPAVITDHATVIDWPTNPKDGMSHGRVLRQGTNGWTCMPDVPGRPQHDPMCVDETMMKWIDATLAGKKPGAAREAQLQDLVFAEHGGTDMRPYDRLIGAALDGQRMLFAQQDTVEAAWRVVDPVLGDVVPVHPYPRGSWGPKEADALLPNGDTWHDPAG